MYSPTGHRVIKGQAPSVEAYKRELSKRLGLKGKQLQAAAECAMRHGSVKDILRAAAYAV